MNKIQQYNEHLRGKILKHVLIWVSIYIAYTIVLIYAFEDNTYRLINILNLFLFMLAYYAIKHIIIRNWIKDKRWAVAGVSCLVLAVVLYFLYFLGWYTWLDQSFEYSSKSRFYYLQNFLLLTVRFFSPALAIIAGESLINHRKDRQRRILLEQEKARNELRFLKAQINPHFLFNTLNNLYSFVMTKSNYASLMITKLIAIIEYALNENQKHYVELEKEVSAICNYIDLEMLRYGDRLIVETSFNLVDGFKVSPLIMLSIVENAFKHGVSGDIDVPKVTITINCIGRNIECRVWNTKSSYHGELADSYKKGIGLGNIKRQLDIIYPDKHSLEIKESNLEFEVKLKIDHNHE